MCPTSRSWVLRTAPLSLGRLVRFQPRSKTMVLQGSKPPFFFGWSWKHTVKPIKEGPITTSKPNSSNLGKHQSQQHSFTLVYQSLLQNGRFQTCAASTCGMNSSSPTIVICVPSYVSWSVGFGWRIQSLMPANLIRMEAATWWVYKEVSRQLQGKWRLRYCECRRHVICNLHHQC
jgi:hypothetical protein